MKFHYKDVNKMTREEIGRECYDIQNQIITLLTRLELMAAHIEKSKAFNAHRFTIETTIATIPTIVDKILLPHCIEEILEKLDRVSAEVNDSFDSTNLKEHAEILVDEWRHDNIDDIQEQIKHLGLDVDLTCKCEELSDE
jgi:valyl-tRNA synthetase